MAGVDGKSDSSDGYIDGCCKKAGGGDRRWRAGWMDESKSRASKNVRKKANEMY